MPFSAKYPIPVSDNTSVSAFSSVMHLASNTPNQKARPGAVDQLGAHFLMTKTRRRRSITSSTYSIPTDFEYVGPKRARPRLVDRQQDLHDAVYNKQKLHGVTSVTATSATDKLNSYRKYGNNLPLSYVSDQGSSAPACGRSTRRPIAIRRRSDPRTWVDAALPNFHEMFGTTTLQPYAEFSWRALPTLTITPGVKYAYYRQNLTQFADNGKTVGNLNGAASVQSRRRVSLLAAVGRCARADPVVLVGLRAIRKGQKHSALERF